MQQSSSEIIIYREGGWGVMATENCAQDVGTMSVYLLFMMPKLQVQS